MIKKYILVLSIFLFTFPLKATTKNDIKKTTFEIINSTKNINLTVVVEQEIISQDENTLRLQTSAYINGTQTIIRSIIIPREIDLNIPIENELRAIITDLFELLNKTQD
ncbi:MAG: hypothetical protein ABIF12_01405 [bacterium]